MSWKTWLARKLLGPRPEALPRLSAADLDYWIDRHHAWRDSGSIVSPLDLESVLSLLLDAKAAIRVGVDWGEAAGSRTVFSTPPRSGKAAQQHKLVDDWAAVLKKMRSENVVPSVWTSDVRTGPSPFIVSSAWVDHFVEGIGTALTIRAEYCASYADNYIIDEFRKLEMTHMATIPKSSWESAGGTIITVLKNDRCEIKSTWKRI